jgi:hypothetical protein
MEALTKLSVFGPSSGGASVTTLAAALHTCLTGGAVYIATVEVVALTAVFTRRPDRRHAAYQVLKILLLRTPRDG